MAHPGTFCRALSLILLHFLKNRSYRLESLTCHLMPANILSPLKLLCSGQYMWPANPTHPAMVGSQSRLDLLCGWSHWRVREMCGVLRGVWCVERVWLCSCNTVRKRQGWTSKPVLQAWKDTVPWGSLHLPFTILCLWPRRKSL